MKEERLNDGTVDLNRYIEQAQQLRSRELAKMGGRFFKMPQSALRAIGSRAKASNKAVRHGS